MCITIGGREEADSGFQYIYVCFCFGLKLSKKNAKPSQLWWIDWFHTNKPTKPQDGRAAICQSHWAGDEIHLQNGDTLRLNGKMGFLFKIGYSFDDRLVPNHRPADVEQRRARWWLFEWWAAESTKFSASFCLHFWPGRFYFKRQNSCCRQNLCHYRKDIKPGGNLAAVNWLGRAHRLKLLML